MHTYAGIGLRETPFDIQVLMFKIARAIPAKLHSGGAPGADHAFEKGAVSNSNKAVIYLPWNNFCNKTIGIKGNIEYTVLKDSKAAELAANVHPNWNACSKGAKMLHARNSYQVLGSNLNTPVNLVICWTKDGKLTGGTAQALRIAKMYNIPVINFGEKEYNSDMFDRRKYAEYNIRQIFPTFSL